MDLFPIKLMITPALIAGTTMATRRWGPVVGGLLVGLPVMSAPVSVFLALEQGREFATTAARSTLLASIALAAYSVAYAVSARRYGWRASIVLSLLSYFVLIAFFSKATFSLIVSTLLVAGLTLAGCLIVKPVAVNVPALAAPRWDLPFRMTAATAIVVTITQLSSALGPEISGLLSTFPVFVSVMSIFSHKLYGSAPIQQFQRGVLLANFSFGTFFVTVSLALSHSNMPLFPVYLTACVASAVVNLSIFKFFVFHRANPEKSRRN